MAQHKLMPGKDAQVSIQLQYIHPSQHVRDKFPNRQANQCLADCVVTGMKRENVNQEQQLCVTFQHEDFKNNDGSYIQMYCLKHWAQVTAEGPSDFFFSNNIEEPTAPTEQARCNIQELVAPSVAEAMTCSHVDNSELAVFHGVVDIDDDNTPAPENLPTNNNNLPVYDNNLHHDSSCFCCILDANNVNTTIKNWPCNVIPTDLQLFEHLFPCAFVKTVMLPKMNVTMPAGAPQLQYGEFFKWIGIWFLMATTNGENWQDFWSQKPFNMYSSAPFCLHDIMSHNHFEQILSVLMFMDMEPPPTLTAFGKCDKCWMNGIPTWTMHLRHHGSHALMNPCQSG